MGERLFKKALYKEGSATLIREQLSSSRKNYLDDVEIIDYELYIIKNTKLLQNNILVELILFPATDFEIKKIPNHLTLKHNDAEEYVNLFTKSCLKSLNSLYFNTLNFNYKKYHGSYSNFLRLYDITFNLNNQSHECNLEDFKNLETSYKYPLHSYTAHHPTFSASETILKYGFLYKGIHKQIFIGTIKTHVPDMRGTKLDYVEKFFTLSKFCCTEHDHHLNKSSQCIFVLKWNDRKGEKTLIHAPPTSKNYLLLNCPGQNNNKKTLVQRVECNGKYGIEIVSTKNSEACQVYLLDKNDYTEESLVIRFEEESLYNEWFDALSSTLQSCGSGCERKRLSRRSGHVIGSGIGLRDRDSGAILSTGDNVFLTYAPIYQGLDGRPSAVTEQVRAVSTNLRFLFWVEDIEFAFRSHHRQVELYQTFVTIYDAKYGCQITETFHFDANRTTGSGSDPSRPVPAGRNQKAYFEVHGAHSQMYLVIFVEKLLLKGSVTECTQPYRLPICTKTSDKYRKQISDQYEKFAKQGPVDGAFGQEGLPFAAPFCVAVKPLMDPGRRPKSPGTANLDGTFGIFSYPSEAYPGEGEARASSKNDECHVTNGTGDRANPVHKFLSDYRGADDKHNHKSHHHHHVVPGVVRHTMELSRAIDPLDEASSDIRPDSPGTERILEFDHPSKGLGSYAASDGLINRFYIYPKCLNFQDRASFPRARNIHCTIQCKPNDLTNGSPLALFNAGPGGSRTQARTPVFYHETAPCYYSEFKIDLPTGLEPMYNLLFTFYHVSVNPNNKQSDKRKEPPPAVIGYTWIPLLKCGNLIHGTYHLPVSANLVDGYLSYPKPQVRSPMVPPYRRQSSTNSYDVTPPIGSSNGDLTFTNGDHDPSSTSRDCGPGGGFKASATASPLKWLQAGKPLFKVSFDFVSSLHTKDGPTNRLFAHVQKSCHVTKTASQVRWLGLEDETLRLLENMNQVDLGELIKHFNPIFSLLVQLLTTSDNPDIAQTILKLMVKICDELKQNGQGTLVSHWLDNVLAWEHIGPSVSITANQPPFHHVVLKNLVEILKPTSSDQMLTAKLMNNFDFVTKLTLKGIALWLHHTGTLEKNRMERFSSEFLYDIKNLCLILTSNITAKSEYRLESKAWNTHLANLFQGMFAMMDRGFVFDLIHCHLVNLDNDGPRKDLMVYKVDFLEVLYEYEHFIPLNLVTNRQTVSLEISLDATFVHNHFLVGFLFRILAVAMFQCSEIRSQTIRLTRDLLIKHSLDPRYQSAEIRDQIALLYLPFLGICMENVDKMRPRLHLNVLRTRIYTQGLAPSSLESQIDSIDHSPQRPLPDATDKRTRSTATDNVLTLIAGQEFASFPAPHSQSPFLLNDALHKSPAPPHIKNGHALEDEAGKRRSLHLPRHDTSMGYPYSAIGDHPDKNYNDKFSNNRSSNVGNFGKREFTELSEDYRDATKPNSTSVLGPFLTREKMDLCITMIYVFNSLGPENQIAFFGALGGKETNPTLNLHTFLIMLYEALYTFDHRSNLFENSQLYPRNSEENNVEEDHSKEFACDRKSMWDECCANVSLSVANALFMLGDCYKFHKRDDVLDKIVIDLCCALLQDFQSTTVIIHVLRNLDQFITSISLYDITNRRTLLTSLFYQVIRKWNSPSSQIREQSCHTFYKILWNHFVRHKTVGTGEIDGINNSVMVALSQFMGDDQTPDFDKRLSDSLSYVGNLTPNVDLLYDSTPKIIQEFQDFMEDLLVRVRSVQQSTSLMKKPLTLIPELFLDVEYQLAKSYSYDPELRRTWLTNLAKLNVKFGNFSEAALCYLHTSAIISRFLALKDDFYEEFELRFHRISPNIVTDEYELTKNYLALNLAPTSHIYHQQLLIETLLTATDLIEKSERFEMLDHIYHMMIAIYKRDCDYLPISEAYEKLRLAYEKIYALDKSGKRYLGQYYKVNFYGEKFESDNGREYVYKEPKVTRLSEISLRLKGQYAQLFGMDCVKLITHSNEVEVTSLEKGMAYIQISHLQPYFADKVAITTYPVLKCPGFGLSPKSRTVYDTNDKVQCFYYETPFTTTLGKIYGNVGEQWKKKNIVKAQNSFPYIKTRIPIIWKDSFDLSPIESAIDEMEKKVQELFDLYNHVPCDIVKLQLQLQGAISTQVNLGPMAYAQAFLAPEHSSSWDQALRSILRDAFITFNDIIRKCIILHSKFYHKAQTEFHNMIVENFEKFTKELAGILNETTEGRKDVNNSALEKSHNGAGYCQQEIGGDNVSQSSV